MNGKRAISEIALIIVVAVLVLVLAKPIYDLSKSNPVAVNPTEQVCLADSFIVNDNYVLEGGNFNAIPFETDTTLFVKPVDGELYYPLKYEGGNYQVVKGALTLKNKPVSVCYTVLDVEGWVLHQGENSGGEGSLSLFIASIPQSAYSQADLNAMVDAAVAELQSKGGSYVATAQRLQAIKTPLTTAYLYVNNNLASQQAMPFPVFLAMIHQESGFNVIAAAGGSSARGLGQITSPTWNSLVDRYYATYLANRYSSYPTLASFKRDDYYLQSEKRYVPGTNDVWKDPEINLVLSLLYLRELFEQGRVAILSVPESQRPAYIIIGYYLGASVYAKDLDEVFAKNDYEITKHIGLVGEKLPLYS
ncbi:MAG: hypothetical protein H6502_02040 [Candidatus Woesearchaeota archaeon]|nr:MAG: hypothetical protein H6502_02040 [Candidatus Woesearchaeota archaeon]